MLVNEIIITLFLVTHSGTCTTNTKVTRAGKEDIALAKHDCFLVRAMFIHAGPEVDLDVIKLLKVQIHFRKFSTERKIFRGPHALYDFFFRKFSEVYLHL